MKDNKMILRLFALLLMVWMMSVCDLCGQSYKIGDLYTFDDGSMGIVFYVNPDDPGSGTVAALNDLDGQYALWTGSMPQALTDVFASNGGIFFNSIITWENHGKRFTQVLRESGVSPAANAINVDAGWYIPDILQLQKLYSSTAILKGAFENNGGDIMTLWNTTHWSATRISNSSNKVYAIRYSLGLDTYYGTQSCAIRPVRDFPDTAVVQAYWVENAPHSDTVVAPDITQSYNARVIYRSDTMSLTATVTVHQPVVDTLYEAVYKSMSPYTSIVEPLFSDLDISLPGVYEYRDTLSSANGCDSIIVLKLTVGNNVRYADTLCPLKTDLYFAPFDTVFSVGTVSGLYEHHGVRLVDGVPVDTVAYYELTILPEYQRFDTVIRCLYETTETWTYDGNMHVSIAVNGTSVTVASDTDAVVVEEVTPGMDYNLKMRTVSGCDSVTHLHLDLHRVSRDTVYKDMLITQLVGGATTVACHTFTGLTAPGTYFATDTLVATNGCDSLMTVFLTVEPLHTETLCDSVLAADLTWTGNLSGYTWNGQPLPAGVGASGYYEFPGQKTLNGELVDTVSYLQLVVNQKYEERDTVSFCLYEPAFTTTYNLNSAVTITVDAGDGVAVTSSDAGVEVLPVPGSATDFALKMQTVSGCDSVVFLHMDVRRVSRDTVRHYAYMHQVESERITVDGHEFTGITGTGTYELRDTLAAANGCDSIIVLKLTVGNNVRYTDTLCPLKTDFYFAPFDTVFSVGTVSGLYEHHGIKMVDGVPVDTVAYYELTILPEYQRFDTLRRCLYETAESWTYDSNAHVSISVDGTSVTVVSDTDTVVVEEVTSGTDYNLKMQTVSGCDSVTHLHLDLRRVSRDTVYKDMLITQLVGGATTVACHTFTGITAPGTYSATDTLVATNGCDSIMTVFLMIEPLHTETLCDSVLAADLTWTGNLAGYTWNGQPLPAGVGASGYYEFSGQKTLDGELVDTVSYLQLIVNQKYERRDTATFCLYEPTFTTTYDLNSTVTITVDAGDGVAVTSSDAGVEVLSVPGSVTDFALKMQTVSGCDSVVFLHVDVRRVSRDTVRHYAYMHQVESERITVDGREFTNITGAGTYELRDTLVAANGCDSIIVLKLTVGNNVRYTDTLCPLKTDFYFAPFDTVFTVGTVSGLYEHHGVRLVDGVPVDTVAYYELTILPEYQWFDTVRRCLYETAETWPYDGNAHVSIAVNGTSVTVASDTAAVVVEEVTSGTDYNLKMQTVSGCDSVTHLHLDLRRVSRDTVYKDMLITQLVGGATTVACHTFTGITAPGTYFATDTLVATNGCDSLMTVFLTVEPLHTETLCDSVLAADLTWTGNLSGYTWNGQPLPAGVGASGYYEFSGQKTLDGELVDTVSYLQLIVNQKYERRDTASFCLYEPTFTTTYDFNSAVTITVDAGDGITVTTSDAGVEVLSVPGSVTDFALKMQTVSGCDSVVFLHVNVRRVSRDTVRHYAYMHQVESERITVDGREYTGITGAGTYELHDTLVAANGCDSIIVLKLTVGNNVRYTDTLCPLKTDFYFAPFDTVFSAGTVSGLYEHHGVKLVDGVPVDTVAYYELTILPEYQWFDTVRRCLYETAETWPYDGNAHVSIAVNGTSVTVVSDTDAVVVEEVTSGMDYNLKMQTVSGCDSVTHLHLDLRRVSRDTVYKDLLITQLVGGAATVACHTFTGITAPGTYAATDTLVATNGCDSIMTVFLMVEPLHTETLCDSVLAADLTWTGNFAGYTWNAQPLPAGVGASGYYEFPGQKTLDGELVDTVSYLQLIVNQKYDAMDTASFCLYEPTFTTTYDLNSTVTITVDAGDGIAVTSSDAGVEVLSVPGSVTDFALKMQTVSGCDSVVFLHVNVRRVSRDTVRHYAYMHQVESERITVDGHEFTNITGAGTYELRDTLVAANGCDSIIVLKLTVGNNVRYADTLCPLKTDLYFAPFDTVFSAGTVSGLYEHHGIKMVDGVPVDTVAYYELTILPEYQWFDTVRRCLYETAESWPYESNAHVSISVDGTSVTVASDTDAIVVEEVTANADYRLKMQTMSGCDSVTHLHLDLRRVSRDTVYKDLLITQLVGGATTVACHTFTGLTAPGTYFATDTLVATNGCDSLMTVFLTVEPLHTETLCDSVLAADLTWTGNLSGYTWNGQPLPAGVGASGYYEFSGQKTLDGELVDTVSYLQLVVNQKYEAMDTASFCLYEPTFTTMYDLNSAVTIAVDAGDGITVTSSDAGVEVLPVPGSVTDFALKMQTVSGCDSVVFLHVNVRRVSRDTVRHYTYMHQVENEQITVDGREFTGITGAGTYELRDTLVAANGCDSVVLHELTVEACASGFTILCPPDVYDTLAYGDCAMTIYPDRIGTATVQYDVAWPFAISNNMPSDNLFAQGDNVITWTATDLACGGSVSCEQHVFIAFPQCPDAVDFEGNVYRGVRVGCDCWTQRNLESKRYSDGTDISGQYAYASQQYPDIEANVAIFGRLYSYEAAVRDTADNGYGHVQGICPKGWYLPTPEKYEGLNAYGADALRSPDYWIIGAGNNSTGFTALPAGFYNGELDRYEGLLTETYFWSTKSVSQANPKCLYSITYYCDFVLEKHSYSGLGYSVRCIKEK